MTEKNVNKVSVQIHRQTYTIVGSESKAHVEHVAQLVNDKMKEIHENNKHLDTTSLAVLTAINTMNDYLKLKADYDDLLTLLEEDS